MAILKIRDENGAVIEIPVLVGEKGEKGDTPVKGVDYFDGKNGSDGQDGKDGYTPVKGTDYFTEADKEELVAEVLAQLPVYNGEASGFCSHAEGSNTQATNYYSHSEGLGTIAAGRNQTAMGKYNVKDTSSLLIVGNGTKDTARSNAFKLDASGNGTFSGKVTASGTPSADNDLVTIKYLKDNIAKFISDYMASQS